LVNIS